MCLRNAWMSPKHNIHSLDENPWIVVTQKKALTIIGESVIKYLDRGILTINVIITKKENDQQQQQPPPQQQQLPQPKGSSLDR